MEGIIFDIKHCAIHDGPGIRTTIFFKGCPLNCWWCHNPESINSDIQKIKRIRKIGNTEFAEEANIGRRISVAQALEEIEKDLVFYEESGGGVTFSGGEPLMQPEFLKELAENCKKKGIHTTLDTSGHANVSALKMIMPYIDLFLFDIKLLDDNIHQKYTGVSHKQILKTLEFISIRQKKIIIRYPLIPGVNNSPEQLSQLRNFIDGRYNEIHILPYHKIASHKYKKLGIENKLPDINPFPKEYLENLKKDFRERGFDVKIGG